MIYVVTYRFDPGATTTMDEVRPRHREFLAGLHEQGHLLASGPWVGETPGAYLLMSTASGEAALSVLEADPYRAAGVIAQQSVQAWNPVIGSLA